MESEKMRHKPMFVALLGVFIFSILTTASKDSTAYEVCNEPCDADEMEIQKGIEILERQYGVQWISEINGNCLTLKNNQSIALFCNENGVWKGCEYCRFG